VSAQDGRSGDPVEQIGPLPPDERGTAYTVCALRRYPVKCLGGESADELELDGRGVAGDRWYAVQDADGHLASGKSTRRFRRRDGAFDYTAATVGEAVRVSGPGGSWLVGDPDLDTALSERLGLPVRLASESEVPHQDGGAVSLVGTATLDWFAREWGVDAEPRRLRTNVVVDTSAPFVEETWVGRHVRVGSGVLRVVERIPRCRTIDVPQDGVEPQVRWLTRLSQERDMCAGVYADVLTPGWMAVGDVVRVVGADDPAPGREVRGR
jgi:uncharacterized protein